MSDTNGYEISIKEYAAQRNKTVQAVYQQMKRPENAKALQGHVVLRWVGNKRVKFLDEKAVTFLDDASNSAPMVYMKGELEDALESAKNEISQYLMEVAKRDGQIELLLQQLAEKERELRALAEPQSRIDALEAQNADLSAERDKEKEDRLEAEKTAQKLSERLSKIEGSLLFKLLGGKYKK